MRGPRPPRRRRPRDGRADAGTLILYILADERCEEALKERAASRPKPLYYSPQFVKPELDAKPDDGRGVDPFGFARPLFPRLLDYRKPRYAAIAEHCGFTIGVNKLFETEGGSGIPDADRFLFNVYRSVTDKAAHSPRDKGKLADYLEACRARAARRARTD